MTPNVEMQVMMGCYARNMYDGKDVIAVVADSCMVVNECHRCHMADIANERTIQYEKQNPIKASFSTEAKDAP